MRTSTFDLFVFSLLGAGIAYFLVDGFFGSTGRTEIARLEAQIAIKTSEVDFLLQQRNAVQKKNDDLRGPVIDTDLLDERLRAAFGLGTAEEFILISPEQT
jgi:cell division protein FtsB